MITVGTEVQIDHEGDKDDGLVGTVLELRAGEALVQFPDGSGGWYRLAELRAA